MPRPKSWVEFENICADLLKRLWQDPYATRHGRAFQDQHGVDILGQPKHLAGGASAEYAGAQCKITNKLTSKIVREEVQKAGDFKPALTEYLLMTTASRDARVLKVIRSLSCPFRVCVMFWDDICLELSGHDDLLQKHFPGWIQKTVGKKDVLNLVLLSSPEDFCYDDGAGVFMHTGDVKLQIIIERSEDFVCAFDEPWVRSFADKCATRQPVHIHYGESRICEMLCVRVDGGRFIVPLPKSQMDLTISQFQYHVGQIVNHPFAGIGFDCALRLAGIAVHG